MSTLETPGAYVTRRADREQLLWAGQSVFDVVLSGAHTAGAIALLEQRGGHGDTTPLHVHRDEAEIFYVIEGGIRAWVGEEVHDLDAGAAVYLPKGRAHAFGIRSEHARVMIITSPAGFADFVTEAGVPVSGELPTTWEFDVGRLVRAAPRHGIDIVGPPPSLT